MKYIAFGFILIVFGVALLSQGLGTTNSISIYIGLGALLLGIMIVGLLIRWGINQIKEEEAFND